MASYVINNLTAPDAYTAASTLGLPAPLPVCDHIVLQVFNTAIYWQLLVTSDLISDRAGGAWQQEIYQAPAYKQITRPGIVGFRFRAATPLASLPAGQSQAQVTVEAVE